MHRGLVESLAAMVWQTKYGVRFSPPALSRCHQGPHQRMRIQVVTQMPSDDRRKAPKQPPASRQDGDPCIAHGPCQGGSPV